jgi:ABC-type polysaccharide/polyol phosphate export permease
MKLSNVFNTTVFFLKVYKLNWYFLLTLYIIPATYLTVMFASSQGSREALMAGLTGFTILVSYNTLFYSLASFTSNMFEEQIFESYFLMPIPFHEILMAAALMQILINIPPTLMSLIMLTYISANTNFPLLLSGILLTYAFFIPPAILLAIKVKRRMLLESFLMILMLIMIMATPAFYRLQYISEPYKTLLLANPLTHLIIMLRASIGLMEGFPENISTTYITTLTSILWITLWYKLRKGVVTMAEKRI